MVALVRDCDTCCAFLTKPPLIEPRGRRASQRQFEPQGLARIRPRSKKLECEDLSV
jgi:hypothetical protein